VQSHVEDQLPVQLLPHFDSSHTNRDPACHVQPSYSAGPPDGECLLAAVSESVYEASSADVGLASDENSLADSKTVTLPQSLELNFTDIQRFEMVDAKDHLGHWFQACVVKKYTVLNAMMLRVHFMGWSKDCDENVTFSRVRPFSPLTDVGPNVLETLEDIRRNYSLTPLPAPIQDTSCSLLQHGELRAVMRCDAIDSDGIWYDAVVVRGSTTRDSSVKIHYNGWPKSQSKSIRRQNFRTHVRPHSGQFVSLPFSPLHCPSPLSSLSLSSMSCPLVMHAQALAS
jgi:hypothetical protein